MRHPLQCCWFPLPCKGNQAHSRAGGYVHITALVRLCHSFRSFCKQTSPRKPFAEPSLPLPASTPIHNHVLHKSSLFLTSLWLALLPGQKAGTEAPHRCQSWALPTCSAQEETASGIQHSPGVSCPHLMAEDRVHTWDLFGSFLQMQS